MVDSLGTKVLPARSAAQRASANFAGQLDSSDEEDATSRKRNVAKRQKTNPDKNGRGRADSLHSRPLKRAHSPISSDETEASSNYTRQTVSSRIMQPADEDETWSLNLIEDYVFVFVNERGDVYTPDTDAVGYIWWPGKVTEKRNGTMEVSLFGKLKPGPNQIHLPRPSRHNIITFIDKHHEPRFIDHPADLHQSPRKRQKSNDPSLHDQWSKALKLAFEQKEADDDGLPEVGFALSSYYASVRTPSAATETQESDSEPEEPPDDIDPFTIVYARDRRNRTAYWPARVMEYVPGKRKRRGRWRVQFVDNTEELIPRDWFFTMDQDQFGLCQLGQFDTQALDDPEDTDGEDANDPREASPLPLDPPPNREQFLELSIREQFSYVKPVLQAVLHNRYLPAKANHHAFITGGAAREALSKEAGLRGLMGVKEAEEMQEYLQEWCLRKSRLAKKMLEDDTANDDVGSHSRVSTAETAPNSPCMPPSSLVSCDGQTDVEDGTTLATSQSTASFGSDTTKFAAEYPPQTGCAGYESLNHMEKVKYCLDVLYLEAKRQILLWREGLRTTSSLLNDEQEQELWYKGTELLQRTDWVRDAQRLRASKERQLEKAGLLIRKVEQISNRALRALARTLIALPP